MDDKSLSLPYSREAEEYILGGILMENTALDSVCTIVSAEDFYIERNRILFEQMVRLMDKGLPIDLVSLTESVERTGKLDKVGGAAYISQLADIVPTTANIEYYARIVRDKSILRSLINGASEIIRQARSQAGEVADILESAEQIVYAINREIEQSGRGLTKIGQPIQNLYEKLRRMASGEVDPGIVSTGFERLDIQLLGGLHRSDLIIIAGRPSMGKTSLALNIAQNVAVRERLPVAVFSLEMGIDQLALRMLAAEAWVDQGLVRSSMSVQRLRKEDWSKLIEASEKLYEAPIYIDDTPGVSPMEIRSKVRRLMSQVDLRLIVVDYLQLMSLKARTDSREQEISEISRTLKAIAKEFNVPLIAVSQLNRRVEERHDKRPMMSDLRESGAIEQDADVICFIYREDFYTKDKGMPPTGIAEVIVAKHRNGPTGTVELVWMPEFTRFGDLDVKHQEPQGKR
ncbi:MAG TPA: replicative DNA helicase [Deltaproteobacteria bacterium]|nr:replicative DNA helicase [Deltaproteobacteria bacterium]HPP80795.1 replicative DNA helicase [Deltaproteobacteria bacterium]